MPLDRPALTLTSTERDDAVDDINTYFSDFQAMTGRIYVEARL